MVDFKPLVKKKQSVDVADLTKLFESLDRHASHTDLRPTQKEALKLIQQRRIDRDLVLKISTGAGKTTVALLYLLSHMEEKGEPVVYLCPTVQLVEQVKQEATKLGIDAVIYPAGEPYPHVDGTSAKAIIICTYDKLFNAKSTFDRPDVRLRPYAIVLDDAHAGIEEVREAFTLHVSVGDLYGELIKVFHSSVEKYKPATWQMIIKQAPNSALEVPYWIWKPVIGSVQKIIGEKADSVEFMFVWPFIQDILRWCRCIISGNGIEIIPDIQPVHKCMAYSDAKYRMFMSATLAEDSILVQELGCSILAATKPLLPKGDRGLGERMVLAPSLINIGLNRNYMMKLCGKLAKKVNVVVLSPNKSCALEWEKFGAKVVIKEEVSSAVADLNNESSGLRFVVFVQRYDGLDLPDNACRILVIDGIPFGEGIVDSYDSHIRSVAGGTRNRLIYRIEQGMGRAVRSHVDYAVILLVGPALAHFIAKHEVLKAMNADTKAQLKLALDLAKLAEDEEDSPGKTLYNLIVQCLKRDQNWKQYYNENVRNKKSHSASESNYRLNMAEAEREAFQLALRNSCRDAVESIRKAIDSNALDENEKGFYLQKVANYMYEVEPGESLQIQLSAHEKNDSMFCPPGIVRKPYMPGKFNDQTTILQWFKNFGNPNGAIAAIEDLRSRLSYDADPSTIEQAIMELAPLIGANGSRPEQEHGEGPDDLWLWSSIGLVIEAKNQNEKTLHKKDAGQLLLSLEWFKRSYSGRDTGIPVIIAKVAIADRKAGFPDKTRVVTSSKMQDLLDKLEMFYQALASEPPLFLVEKKIAEFQAKFQLLPEQFIKRYTVPIEESKK